MGAVGRWLGKFIEEHYGSLGMFVLLFFMIFAHHTMVANHRDPEQVKWLEAQIEAVIVGLIALLQRYGASGTLKANADPSKVVGSPQS